MKEEIMKIIKNNGDKYIDSYDDQADQIIALLSQALQKRDEEIIEEIKKIKIVYSSNIQEVLSTLTSK